MLNKINFELEDLVVALPIWLCLLPLISILVVPLFGWHIGLAAAAILFILAMAICWGICKE